jgi:hypothetical protein
MSLFVLRLNIFITLLTICSVSYGDDWEYTPKGKTIAIGDIHADPRSFLDTLINMKILDNKGNFIGKNLDIVLLGDYAGKGTDTRGVWELIHYITNEAKNNNSRVHSIFGNHDTVILMEDFKRISKKDKKKFLKFDPDPKKGIVKALVSEPYRSMMQDWKAMVKIGDDIFVHGGIDEFIYETHPREINKVVSQFVIDQQNYLERTLKGESAIKPKVPKILTSWVFDSKSKLPDNPFWTRRLSKGKIPKKVFRRMLDYLDAKRLFVGHTGTKSKEIETKYNGKLILADTNSSEGFKNAGELSAVEIDSQASGKIKMHNRLKRNKYHTAYRKLVPYGIESFNKCLRIFDIR